MNETATAPTAPLRARAEIDLAALRANLRAPRAPAPGAAVMAVVNSGGYGRGGVRGPRAGVGGGARWRGTATPEEALALRKAGLPGRIMCWLWTPGGPWREAIEADLDVSVGGTWALRELVAAAREAGPPPRGPPQGRTRARGGGRPARRGLGRAGPRGPR